MSNRNGGWHAYARESQTGRTLLLASGTSEVEQHDSFTWSTDGTRLAIANLSQLRIVDLATRSNVRVPGIPGSALVEPQPAFSPDGSRLAFATDEDLYVLKAHSRPGALHVTDRFAADPDWSPDGKSIVYSVQYGIELIRLNPVRVTTLVKSGAAESRDPQWSPDGRHVAYVDASRRRVDTLVVIEADGSHRREIARFPSFYHDADSVHAWAPNGHELATACGLDLCVADAVSGIVRTVAKSFGGEVLYAPSWSRDGRRLAYLRDRGAPDGADVWVANPDGTGDRALTRVFPHGEDNVVVGWTTMRGHPGPPVRNLVLAHLGLEERIRTSRIVTGLHARGRSVALLEGDDNCRVSIFTPHWAETTRVTWPSPCPRDPVARITIGSVVRTKSGVIWSERYYDDYHGVERWTTVAAAPGGEHLRRLSFPEQDTLGPLVGDGRDTVANTFISCDYTLGCRCKNAPGCLRFGNILVEGAALWRLRGGRWSQFAAGRDAYRAVAVNGGRVALLTPTSVAIRQLDGAYVGRLRFARNAVLDARLLGPNVVTLMRGGTIVLWSVSGRRIHSWPAAVGAPGAAAIEDAYGNYVAYVADSVLEVVRLSDGKTIAVGAANAAPPVHAQLEPAGLFYSYAVVHSRQPGVVAFVPQAAIRRGFKHSS